MYALTKSGMDSELARFHTIEAKVGRYLAALGAILGLYAVGVDELARVCVAPEVSQRLLLSSPTRYLAWLPSRVYGFSLRHCGSRKSGCTQ